MYKFCGDTIQSITTLNAKFGFKDSIWFGKIQWEFQWTSGKEIFSLYFFSLTWISHQKSIGNYLGTHGMRLSPSEADFREVKSKTGEREKMRWKSVWILARIAWETYPKILTPRICNFYFDLQKSGLHFLSLINKKFRDNQHWSRELQEFSLFLRGCTITPLLSAQLLHYSLFTDQLIVSLMHMFANGLHISRDTVTHCSKTLNQLTKT